MKKKYIVPTVGFTPFHLEYSILAGSSDPSKGSGSEYGTKDKETQPTIPTVGDPDNPILGSKQFDAWSAWDE